MPAYLIYIPSPKPGPLDDLLCSVGLECLGAGGDNRHTIEQKDVFEQSAPDGRGGKLVTLTRAREPQLDPPFRYLSEKQVWTPVKPDPSRNLEAGRYWLGRMKDETIGPECLARPRQYSSTPIKLVDGHEWQMPIARRLPQNLEIDDSGNWSKRVKPEMSDYFDRSETLFGVMLKQAPYRLDVGLDFAVRGLGMNYYINRDIASWLGLLDETRVTALVGAAFEVDQLREIRATYLAALAQKKTEEEPSCKSPES